MSDVLKQAEDALDGLLSIGKRDLTNPKYDGYFEECRSALVALRGLAWLPVEWALIADMPEDGGIKCFVGRWVKHGRKWEWLTSEGWGNKKAARRSGYTHFCRPTLPTPPKREVE